jgi:2-polyprenyl-3-methyl-5-hydroxy-6-metoxy-1,4-benzoquinol methylase
MRIHAEEIPDVTRYIEIHKRVRLEDNEAEFASTMSRLRSFVTIDSNTNMLEVGTGTGWFPIRCKQKGLHCKGLEISWQLVEYAKAFGASYGIEPDIELANIEEADLGHSTYDVIIAASVFEHVQDWKTGLGKIYDALKPGGLLYFNSTNRFAPISQEYYFPLYGWLPDAWRYRLRAWRQGEQILKLGIDFNQFTYPQLRRAFIDLGFSKVMDFTEALDPNRLNNPTLWKKVILRSVKGSKPIRQMALTFAPSTTFFCIK